MKLALLHSGKLLGLATVFALAAISQARPITVSVNGQMVQFEGAQPHWMEGQICVPLRAVYETTGGTVEWNADTRTVMAQSGSKQLELQLGTDIATINGDSASINGPVHIMEGTTMVPVRFLADSMGATVEWNEEDQQVNLMTADNEPMKTNPSSTEIEPVPSTAISPDVTTTVPDLPPVMSFQPKGSVIQARLDNELSSSDSYVGEPFTATIDTEGNPDYFGLPSGTKVKGHVAFIQPMANGEPGVIGLSYDGLILEDGRRMSIWASPIGIDTDVSKGDDGRWTVSPSGDTKDDMKYVGSGSTSGMLIPLITTGTTVSADRLDQAVPSKGEAYDVMLSAGTALGIRIDRDATIRMSN